MADLADFFSATNPGEDPLRTDIVDMVLARYHATPRHQQVEAGPSDISHPCHRKLAFKLMGVERCNPAYDPLPSIIGTSLHTWLESAAELANEQLGRQRWLTETRVEVTPGLSGSCDLFDTDTGTVIDHKTLGVTTFMAALKGPNPAYRAQVNLYGRGFERAGYDVNRVAIAYFPRAGTLSKMHLWQEPYNPAVAQEALTRRDQVIGLLDDLRVEQNPERYRWIPATPASCLFCPWWRPEPTSPLQCKGDQ